MEGSIFRSSIIVLLLASFLAVSPIICEVRGEAVGVKVGDWVRYGVTGNYPGLADIDWIKIEITKVDGTIVTARMTGRMLNGTEPTPQDTDFKIGSSQEGIAGVGFIIPANLGVGDTTYFGGTAMGIAQETTKTYGGVSRTVVGISINVSVVGQVSTTVFWDKPSGFLLEASSSSQGQSLSIVASAFSIGGVNAGGGGELLGLGWWIWVIIVAVVVVVIVGLAFVLLRRKHPITTVPPPPETPPPP